METIHVKLTGISPLLMHSFPLLPIEAIEKKSPEEQAELAAYRQPAGTDGIRAICTFLAWPGSHARGRLR